ncbi:MazG-like family protein [uncultured Chryseobacterium sp.]|uniref:MazG-like family protein n=1 Tax=uncultured Chryseobacterium sp. TaxID=259322 RepID=UPI0025E80EEB|nr:MazG-like family protein [uncultured Chryseobacterium sp.]
MEKENVITQEKELFRRIENWAQERNFFDAGGATLGDQILKLGEEFGELTKHAVRSEDIKDDLGDMLVVLVIVAKLAGTDLVECVRVNKSENIFETIIKECENKEYFENTLNTIKPEVLQIMQYMGDLASAFFQNDDLKEPLSNILVGLVICAKLAGTTLQHCGEIAYNEIRPRKGKFIDGVFVKEADLNQ